MKKIMFLLTVLPCWLWAQTGDPMDSLQKIAAQKRASQDHLGEATALFEIGNIYYEKQEDKTALEFIQKALQRLPEGNPKLKGRLLYRKAMLLYFIGQDFSQSLPILDSAYILLKPSNDPQILAPFLQSYGTFLTQNLQYKKALKILLETEQICLRNAELGTTDRMLNLYSNLLSAAYSLGDYKAALTFARKGIEAGNESKNYELIADLYYNNALTLSALGYDKDAELSYLKSLELSKKGNVASGIINAKTALGEYYNSQNQTRLGLRYLAEAKAAAAKAQDLYAVAVVNKMEAVHYFGQKNYPSALAAIDSCIQYFEKNNDPRLIQGVFYEKAKILKARNQLEEAVLWAKKELEKAQQANSYSYINSSYLLLSEIEKSRSNFEQALDYHERYTAYKDSVYTSELESKLAEEHTKQNIEAEQDARQKAELETDLLHSRNHFFVAIAFGLLIILLVGGYLFWQLRKSRQQLEKQNLQLSQLNATKDKFFGIIAHDLRNPLTAFQGVGEQLNYYLEKGDTAKLHKISGLIAKSAANLSGLLDNLLSWALLNRGMIPYSPEPLDLATEAAANFEIHGNAAAAKNIQLENNIPEDLKVQADRNALQAILRNLVGNAVKFTPAGGRVTLGCEEKDHKVFIAVNDTGTGIATEKLAQLFTLEKRSEHGTEGEKGAGLGLLLCKELVELNQGILRVFSVQGQGSKFEFSLPKG